jgi:two-component system, cell cycle response regulator
VKKFRRGSLSLRQRFTFGIVARLLPLLVLSIGGVVSLENTISSFKNTEEKTLQDVFPLKDLESLIFDASQPVEDYLKSGDRQQRDRFFAVSRKIDDSFAQLLLTNSQDLDKKPLIQASQRSWQQLRQTSVAIFAYPYPINQKILAEEQQRLDLHSREAIESISRLYNFLYHVQTDENIEQVKQLRETVRWIVFILLGLELTVAAIAGVVFFRSFLVPLKSLEKGVQHLSEGDLDYEISLMTSDELGQLAATLNEMAGKLKQTQTELQDLAIKDGLTGLYNRREFNKQIKAEIERSQRYQHDCSLLMMDIDYFKKLNDTYGHQGGDEALQAVAKLLQHEVRPVDRVSRYGGEEFVVILPQTSVDSAAIVAERLRSAIATHLVPVSPTESIHISVSIGFATFPDYAKSEEALISCADQALYHAKRTGRNRVVNFIDVLDKAQEISKA